MKKLNTKGFTHGTVALFFVVIFAIAGIAFLLYSHAQTPPFTYMTTDASAAAQPSALGKTLLTLKAFNGKIYAGYGDYNTNTGPIDITAYTPSTNSFKVELPQQLTEAIYLYRNIGGKLYSPSTDPRGGVSTDYAVGTASGGNTTWQQFGPSFANGYGMIHAFDINTTNGSDLWMAGSQAGDHDPLIVRSLDGGATWQKMLELTPPTDQTYDNNRFYFAGAFGGKMYVQAMYYAQTNGAVSFEKTSHVWNGTSWVTGPNLLFGSMGYHVENFAGKMIYLQWQGFPQATSLAAFDGTTAAMVSGPAPFWEYAIDGSTLYGIASNGNVYSTTDLKTWYLQSTAPTTARSIAVLNGQIYVGTTDSKLYSAPINTAPAVAGGGTTSGGKHGGGGGSPGHNKGPHGASTIVQ